MDRTHSGQDFGAVEQRFFEEGLALEAQLQAEVESEAMQAAADQPDGPRRRPSRSWAGAVVITLVVAGVALVGQRLYAKAAVAPGAHTVPMAVVGHAPNR